MELNLETLPKILKAIAADGCSVLRTDRGNGCAGTILVDPATVTEIEVDEIVYLEDAPKDVQEEFGKEVALFDLGELEDHTHVGIKREGNGWTGYYLLWIP